MGRMYLEMKDTELWKTNPANNYTLLWCLSALANSISCLSECQNLLKHKMNYKTHCFRSYATLFTRKIAKSGNKIKGTVLKPNCINCSCGVPFDHTFLTYGVTWYRMKIIHMKTMLPILLQWESIIKFTNNESSHLMIENKRQLKNLTSLETKTELSINKHIKVINKVKSHTANKERIITERLTTLRFMEIMGEKLD